MKFESLLSEGKERPKKEAGYPGFLSGSFNKKRNLLTSLG